MTKQSILLVNLGTPESATPAGVKAFLKPFLSDPRVVSIPRLFWLPLLNGVILPLRCKRVAKAYQSIWFDDGSPLLHYSLLQQKALSALFEKAGQNVNVELAMTYGERSIKMQSLSYKKLALNISWYYLCSLSIHQPLLRRYLIKLLIIYKQVSMCQV